MGGAGPAAGCRGCYNDYVDKDGIDVPHRPLCPGDGDVVAISQSWTSWMESASYDDPVEDAHEGLRIAGLDGLLEEEDRKLRKESEKKKIPFEKKVFPGYVPVLENSPSFYKSSSFYAQKSSGVSPLRASTFNIGQGQRLHLNSQRLLLSVVALSFLEVCRLVFRPQICMS